MIQKYLQKSLLVICGLLFYTSSFAQSSIIAHDDVVTMSNGAVGQLILTNAVENDSVNEIPANLNLVLLAQISTDNPNLSLASDGSVTITQNPVAPGYYRIRYQISNISSPNFVSVATIHIFIGICALTEVNLTSRQACTAAVSIRNLPENEPWHLQVKKDNLPFSTITGTGSRTEIPIPEPGHYSFQATNTNTSCISIVMEQTINSYLCRALSVFLYGTYNDYNSDNYLNAGDTLEYSIIINNTGTTPITDVSVTSASANIFGSVIPILAPNSINSTAFNGRHIITQQDIDTGFVDTSVDIVGTNINQSPETNIYITQNQIVPVRKVAIKAFLDANENGLKDPGENNFYMGQVVAQSTNGGRNRVGYSSLDLIDNDPDHAYNISYEIFPDYAGFFTVSPDNFNNVHVPAVGGAAINFAVVALPYTDVSVALYNVQGSPRPGFTYQNRIRIANNSPLPVASGTLTFTKNNLLTISNISESEITPTAAGFLHAFTNLQPFETREIIVTLQVPLIPIVNLGDLLTNSVAITVIDDISPENNTHSLTATIIGSYDPNDKTESHGGKILNSTFTPNDYLTYTIRFENTGNANAINVKIKDLLEEKLDETTVKMVAASHSYVLERIGKNLTWTFAAIDLPPSEEDSNIGKGYVVFQIKPKPGFAVGDIISNKADIYFDFNPAVITEPALTELVSVLAIADFGDPKLIIYPNPVRNIVRFTTENNQKIDAVSLIDISGKVVLSKSFINTEELFDLSDLSSGIYFARIQAGGKEKIVKLVKE